MSSTTTGTRAGADAGAGARAGLTCRICRAATRLEPNPYHGRGLSVHPHIQVCTRCSAISFPPRAVCDEVAPCDEPPVGWRARLAAWLHVT